MKRREGFKNKVSTPRALLSPEIIILFEMKTLIVIDNFMGAYNYTGNRYIPIRRLMDVLSAVVSSFCHDSNFKKLKNIML